MVEELLRHLHKIRVLATQENPMEASALLGSKGSIHIDVGSPRPGASFRGIGGVEQFSFNSSRTAMVMLREVFKGEVWYGFSFSVCCMR